MERESLVEVGVMARTDESGWSDAMLYIIVRIGEVYLPRSLPGQGENAIWPVSRSRITIVAAGFRSTGKQIPKRDLTISTRASVLLPGFGDLIAGHVL